ncbi:MAG TPA: M1 family metallopeptidase, partial [Pyrinomonadaceae bacterium]|nr:M1 family metallopeptidase [Pyrinomonadaceae bacterium]
MKFKFLLFFLLFFALLFTTLHAQNSRPDLNRVRTYDVQHYIIRVSFDRNAKRIFGDTTVQLKPLAANFKQVELDSEDMVYDSVKLETTGADLKYQIVGKKIRITLDRAYAPTDLIAIRFKYTSRPRRGIYFVPAERSRNEITRAAQIWTQGEPEYAHHWFPSYDFPDDKATTEQFITVEKDETAIGNGELLETIENSDGTQTFHYRMPVRHSVYLVSFVVGKYVKIKDKYKNIPLGIYLYSSKENFAETAFGRTKDMFRIFEDLTKIDYPFNKYDQTIVANYDEFAAMENITATTLSDKEVFFAEFDFGKKQVEDIVAHELAHSWFGNLVTCRNWAELWLNEGFATFMEAAYREKMYGREEYIEKIRNDVEIHFAEGKPKRLRHGL